jgi:hypothetical protein
MPTYRPAPMTVPPIKKLRRSMRAVELSRMARS